MKLSKVTQEVDVEPFEIPDNVKLIGGRSWDVVPIEDLADCALIILADNFKARLLHEAAKRREPQSERVENADETPAVTPPIQPSVAEGVF
jgi:hypothetical protein